MTTQTRGMMIREPMSNKGKAAVFIRWSYIQDCMRAASFLLSVSLVMDLYTRGGGTGGRQKETNEISS